MILAPAQEWASAETRTMNSPCKLWFALFLAFWIFGCGQVAPTLNQPSPEQPRRSPVNATSPERYDLERDEQRGGHTLDRHVGHSDADLRERLEREGNISAASTWTDRVTAEEVVAEALRAERRRIDSWMNRGERRPNLALHYDAGRTIGRSLRRGDNEVRPCTSAVIVLRSSGTRGFYVLTTYPEGRE